jgi:membrane fusion protein (multidrug efflux system)
MLLTVEGIMSDQALAGSARNLAGAQQFVDTGPAIRASRISRRRLLVAGAALCIAAAGAWYGHEWWTVGRFTESTDDAYVGGDITVLAPKVAGFIATVAVIDNQVVHAGDLLVRLDDRDYRAALAKAEAGVAAQRAKLASNAADRRLQASVITQAQAALDSTAAQTSVTRFDADRYRSLARDQFGSVQRSQQADADWKKATAADAQAHAAVEAAERQLDVIDAGRVETEASLAAAIADRDTARLNLSYTELRAPVDGAVGNRSAQLGAYVTPGAQLLSLVPAQGLWVDANFKESQLAGLKPGMPVSIVADVLPGEVFHGHVASMAPATGAMFSVLPAENATGNFTKIVQRVPVRVLLDGDASRLGNLRPGLSVTASVDERPAP